MTSSGLDIWWTAGGSNSRPPRCERGALPAELAAHFWPFGRPTASKRRVSTNPKCNTPIFRAATRSGAVVSRYAGCWWRARASSRHRSRNAWRIQMMARTSLRIAMAAALAGFGWVAGHAQTSEPHFEIVVNAPGGETTIECVRGCKLAWVERGVNSNATPGPTFTFSCGGTRCSSGKVGGWNNP